MVEGWGHYRVSSVTKLTEELAVRTALECPSPELEREVRRLLADSHPDAWYSPEDAAAQVDTWAVQLRRGEPVHPRLEIGRLTVEQALTLLGVPRATRWRIRNAERLNRDDPMPTDLDWRLSVERASRWLKRELVADGFSDENARQIARRFREWRVDRVGDNLTFPYRPRHSRQP